MSRCYPFPPPGYVLKEKSLIESIKVTKDEIKRERKERSHKKEKKRKDRENEADRCRKHGHKRRRKDVDANASSKMVNEHRELSKTEAASTKTVNDHCELLKTEAASTKKVDDHGEMLRSETELLDKSSLTVELELRTSSQNSCDSTLQSNEIGEQSQTQSQPLDGRHNDSEIEMRIQLHGNGQNDHEVMMTNTDLNQCSSQAALTESVCHPCSTSGNDVPQDASRVCQEKRRDPISRKLTKEKKTVLETYGKISSKPSKEKMPSSTIGASKLCRKCRPSIAVQFVNLIENWTPDKVKSKFTDSEDKEWWMFKNFGATRHHQVINQTTSYTSSLMVWPTAQYLSEVELHALPFTVPL